MRVIINKHEIKALLSGDLPGKVAQSKLQPRLNISQSKLEKCREAAVLLLIYSEQDQFRIVFIKRNEYDGHHSGQISFPGGMMEISDHNFEATALRETEEEIGIASSKIEILGELTDFHIPVSNSCVHPFVGWMDAPPDFTPDRSEVQYLICPSLDLLSDPKNRKTGFFKRGKTEIKTPYIDIEGEMLWGATAMILNEFLELIGC